MDYCVFQVKSMKGPTKELKLSMRPFRWWAKCSPSKHLNGMTSLHKHPYSTARILVRKAKLIMTAVTGQIASPAYEDTFKAPRHGVRTSILDTQKIKKASALFCHSWLTTVCQTVGTAKTCSVQFLTRLVSQLALTRSMDQWPLWILLGFNQVKTRRKSLRQLHSISPN